MLISEANFGGNTSGGLEIIAHKEGNIGRAPKVTNKKDSKVNTEDIGISEIYLFKTKSDQCRHSLCLMVNFEKILIFV